MKSDITLDGIFGPIASFLKRFHTLLFFLVVSGGLSAAILILLSIVALSSTTASTSDQAINGTFDEATIQELSEGSSAPTTPGTRTSPFSE